MDMDGEGGVGEETGEEAPGGSGVIVRGRPEALRALEREALTGAGVSGAAGLGGDLGGDLGLPRAVQVKGGVRVETKGERDELLTQHGAATLRDRYLLVGEGSPQDCFGRVASAYGDDEAHGARMYDYMSRLWFMPATPVLSNGGTDRGLPVSCYVNESPDSLEGIVGLWNENVWLASRGGGIGSYWGNLRSLGEAVGENGKTSGIVPFIKVMDAMTLAISQGTLRRGSAAVYVPIDHPEIQEFLDIRRTTGGDPHRKAPNLHHGVVVSDAFMRAVESDGDWALASPKDRTVQKRLKARELWVSLLTNRMETGEPYILFRDAVNNGRPDHHKRLGLEVKTSNLCSEITLPTGVDHLGGERTGVCCLSSVNLEKFGEWSKDGAFFGDVMRFLDNVLEDFIERAEGVGMERARYSAMRERSVGLGAMGFHSWLQGMGASYESATATAWNHKAFRSISEGASRASRELARERGACPDAAECGVEERFSYRTAVAPTASISIICGGASPGVEPINANLFTHKTLSGSAVVRNKALKERLSMRGADTEEVWGEVARARGSVAGLSCLSSEEKEVFRTAFEIDQRWVVDHAADRTPYVDQSQSVNVFMEPDVHKGDLHHVHMRAWKKGLKSLYYCRSRSTSRAGFQETATAGEVKVEYGRFGLDEEAYEECLSCQLFGIRRQGAVDKLIVRGANPPNNPP